MRALLVLYMVKYLFPTGRAESVLGYTTIKGALELLVGPLGVQSLASYIYGFYTGLVYRNRYEVPRGPQSARAGVAGGHPVLAHGLDDGWNIAVGVPEIP